MTSKNCSECKHVNVGAENEVNYCSNCGLMLNKDPIDTDKMMMDILTKISNTALSPFITDPYKMAVKAKKLADEWQDTMGFKSFGAYQSWVKEMFERQEKQLKDLYDWRKTFETK